MERLGDEIVRPGVKDLRQALPQRSCNDHGDEAGSLLGLESPAGLDAVNPGHSYFQDNDLGSLIFR